MSDRQTERLVLDRLSKAWGVRFVMNEDAADCFDAFGYRDGNVIRALVEIEMRPVAWKRFPTVTLPASKVRLLCSTAAFFAAKPLLVVMTDDLVLRWVDLTLAKDLPTDDDVVSVPCEWFKEVSA